MTVAVLFGMRRVCRSQPTAAVRTASLKIAPQVAAKTNGSNSVDSAGPATARGCRSSCRRAEAGATLRKWSGVLGWLGVSGLILWHATDRVIDWSGRRGRSSRRRCAHGLSLTWAAIASCKATGRKVQVDGSTVCRVLGHDQRLVDVGHQVAMLTL